MAVALKMRSVVRGTLLVCVLSCASFATRAAADPAPPPVAATKEPEAMALFNQGVQALQRAAYAQARALFEASLRLQPHPATAFNLAVTSHRMADAASALQTLERLMNNDFGVLAPAQLQEAEALADDVRSYTGLLRMHPTVSGGELRIDGIVVASPERNRVYEKRLNPGRHVVEWRNAGYEPWIESIECEQRKTVEVTPSLVARVTAPAATVTTVTTAAAIPAPTAKPWIKRNWIWLAGGAVVLAAAGAFIAYRATETAANESPFGVTRTLLVP
ncbi:MAG: hypothetical protein SF187_19655 [Deltaproteobacteria bacterium]|nr:hypothetical protein [Deltaproteobacteria bacterium]